MQSASSTSIRSNGNRSSSAAVQNYPTLSRHKREIPTGRQIRVGHEIPCRVINPVLFIPHNQRRVVWGTRCPPTRECIDLHVANARRSLLRLTLLSCSLGVMYAVSAVQNYPTLSLREKGRAPTDSRSESEKVGHQPVEAGLTSPGSWLCAHAATCASG